MTKSEIDYSNTVIYKITCNEPNVTDKYVGHTTNFVQRKSSHKNSTTNEKSDCYNLKLYKTIRENGGWENWRMEMVYFYNCKNLHEAKLKEQEYFIELKATLNSIEPVKTKHIDTVKKTPDLDKIQESNLQFKHKSCNYESKYLCKKCDFQCNKLSNWDKHINTRKHNSTHETRETECKLCNFNTYNKSQLDRHKKTKKHITNESSIKSTENEIPSSDSELMIIVKQLLSKNNELTNRIIEQANEHKKDTVDIITKVIEQMKTNNNINNDYAVIL